MEHRAGGRLRVSESLCFNIGVASHRAGMRGPCFPNLSPPVAAPIEE
ncbi:MAG: hypothetical protein ACHQNE_10570 [Candidatus Kapaibacterium sp.]